MLISSKISNSWKIQPVCSCFQFSFPFFSVGQNKDVSENAVFCPFTVKSRHGSVLRHNDNGNIRHYSEKCCTLCVPTQTGGAFEFLEWASIETMFQIGGGGGGGANLLFSELSTIFCSLTNEEIKLTFCHFFY